MNYSDTWKCAHSTHYGPVAPEKNIFSSAARPETDDESGDTAN
jgi:hypothetical protein